MDLFTGVKKIIESSDREQIETLYQELKASGEGYSQFKSSLSLVGNKLKRLEYSDNIYQHALVKITKAFSKVILLDKNIHKDIHKIAIIAIAYLCDPFDIIPDSNPEIGYIDDVYMFSLALKDIKRISPETYASIQDTYTQLGDQ